MRTRIILLAFALPLLLAAPLLMGQAKTCTNGKTLGWDQMTCCWPGQNVGPFGCTGKPASCPDGLVPTDDGCAPPNSESAARNDYNPAMLDPSLATATAPATFSVKLETTQGNIIIDVRRDWAPNGADRFYNLVTIGYYNGASFFRVISGFMCQFGLHGDPKVNAVWRVAEIQDDPSGIESNVPGYVSFAMAGANSRTTQLFMNLGDNHRLDRMGFAPFGKLRAMTVLEKLYDGYGEGAPSGRGPDQRRIQDEGRAYLKKGFPELDSILKATVMTPEEAAVGAVP